jgi:ribosomal protein S10
MSIYKITIVSKNQQSFSKYFKILKKKLTLINTKQSIFTKKNKFKILTILKSPHVNKTAQEQFGSQISTLNLIIFTHFNPYYLLYILKQSKKNKFSDIKIKVTSLFSNFKSKKTQQKIFNPTNIKKDLKIITLNLRPKKTKQILKYYLQKNQQTISYQAIAKLESFFNYGQIIN